MNMSHSMTEPKEIIIMMIIMFISGMLSSMNIWVDKLSDMRFHLNDVYMSLLMCTWSLLLMGIYYTNIVLVILGICLTCIIIYFIRNQIFIDDTQYLKGMIPHHSMAVLMSKKLLEKINNNFYIQSKIKNLIQNIINSQENEIMFMKNILEYKNVLQYKNVIQYKK
jgi:hypothetical protein